MLPETPQSCQGGCPNVLVKCRRSTHFVHQNSTLMLLCNVRNTVAEEDLCHCCHKSARELDKHHTLSSDVQSSGSSLRCNTCDHTVGIFMSGFMPGLDQNHVLLSGGRLTNAK